jgi:hypothetical protein
MNRLSTTVAVVVTTLLAGCATTPDDDAPASAPATTAPAAAIASGPAATAPTPFTAEQIRDANPRGTRLVFRIEEADAPPVLREMRFTVTDDDTATIESVMLDAGGAPMGEPERSTATWTELRNHAAFPAAATTRSDATCTVPAGRFDCRLYTVRGGTDESPTTSRFHFARTRPGPPVRYEVEKDGEITFRMTLVEDSRR